MATKNKKKPVATPKIEPTKQYVLIRDYPTSKGVVKAGKKIELTIKGAQILTKQKFI